MTSQTQSAFIKDIVDVRVENGPFFSTLKIIDTNPVQNIMEVHYLRRKAAIQAQKIIEELLTANKVGVDLSKLGQAASYSPFRFSPSL